MDFQKEKADFEAEFKKTDFYKMNLMNCFCFITDRYVWDEVQAAWEMWQAAKAQAVPEWISVDDEPPTSNKTFSDAVIAWDGLCIRRIPLCLFKSTSEVTHWMPIPQPPKAQEQSHV